MHAIKKTTAILAITAAGMLGFSIPANAISADAAVDAGAGVFGGAGASVQHQRRRQPQRRPRRQPRR